MDSLAIARSFLGWCAVINIGVLVVAFTMLAVGGDAIRAVHGRMLGLADDDLSRAYFQFLAQYKTLIWIFNITPYFALRILEASL